jgi:F-type H+-transporting ATPase subunit gamma
MAALPSVELAHELTVDWLRRYEARELDTVYVVYNAYRNATLYDSVELRLIPPLLPSLSAGTSSWSPPYVDGDPVDLYRRIVRLWMTAEVYRILIDSAAAEHSARYQLMEGATQNAQRLIGELTLALQAARQQAITSEMQDLAAGAGLLGAQQD